MPLSANHQSFRVLRLARLVWSCYISDKTERFDEFNLIKEICWRATFSSQFEIKR